MRLLARQLGSVDADDRTNARWKRLVASSCIAFVTPLISAGCFPSFPDFPLETSSGGAAGTSARGGRSGGGASAKDGGGSIGRSCQTEGDCDGSPCVAGFCRPACTKDTDCPTGSICLSDGVASGCRLANEAACTSPAGCANSALACGIDGTCRMPCTNTCGRSGVHCISGVCVGDLEPGADSTWFSCQANANYTGHFCDGAALSACNESKPGVTVLAQCSSAGICAGSIASGKSACAPESCAVGELACGGPSQVTLQRCNAERTAFEDVDSSHTCATAALCGELRDSITTPSGVLPPCPSPACAAGDGRCADGKPEACNVGRTGFDALAACSGATLQCSPLTKTCIALGVDGTEVKRGDYQKFLAEIRDPDAGPPPGVVTQVTACSWNTDFTPAGHWSAAEQADAAMPVSNVDWCDAVAYCAQVGKRLCGKIGGAELAKADFADPGKSQWMNACSSGGQHPFPYGDWKGLASESTCNGAGNWLSTETPHGVTVGSLVACSSSVPGYKNTFDLSGNLAEWEDACDADHNAGRPNDACRVRGGSFDDDVQAKLACNADRVVPRNSTLDDVGFRCCGP